MAQAKVWPLARGQEALARQEARVREYSLARGLHWMARAG